MKEASIDAAETLLQRFWEKAGVIQAWGDPSDPSQQGRMIMDCCMNLPLLYWASEETGNQKYKSCSGSYSKCSRLFSKRRWFNLSYILYGCQRWKTKIWKYASRL